MVRLARRSDQRVYRIAQRRIGRGAGALTLLLGLVGFTGQFAITATAAQPGISLIDRIPIVHDPDDASNEIMLDPSARRLLYWNVGTDGNGAVQQIQAYDLDTHRLVASTHPAGFEAWLPWALDPVRHVLFRLATSVPPELEGIDTRTLGQVFTASLPAQMTSTFQGFYWSTRDQLLYDVYCPQVGASCVQQTAIAAIDPSSPANPVVWSAVLPGCGEPANGAVNNADALGETQDGSYLFTVCKTNQSSAAVARLALPANPRGGSPSGSGTCCGTNAVQLFPGLVTGGAAAMALWVPTVDRMVTMVGSNGGQGWSAYVFDAATLHFVSAPGVFVPPSNSHITYASSLPSFGVDPSSGRLLAEDRAQAITGRDPSNGNVCSVLAEGTNTLVVDETSLAGVSVRRFPLADGVAGIGKSLGYDPVAHNWWMIAQHDAPGDSCNPVGPPDAAFFDVYHDALPPALAPPAANPDKQTVDMAEVPGETGSSASADASAYGVRYLLAPSGSEGLMAAPTNGGTCDLNADVTNQKGAPPIGLQLPPVPPQYHDFCNSHARTATFAHVDRVALDQSEAHAVAISGDTDQETGSDLRAGTDFSSPGRYVDDVTGYANSTSASGSSRAAASPAPPLPEPCPTSSPTAAPPSTPAPVGAIVLPTPPANEPTTCDQQLQPVQPYLTGQSLPFTPAKCGDSGGGVDEQSSSAPLQQKGLPNDSPLTYPGSAQTFCSLALEKAEGAASAVSASAAGPLDAPIGAKTATVDAQTLRTNADGSVAIVTATVKDIAVGDLLRIGSLQATATTKAHGRPGTNPAAYSCKIRDLSVTLPANFSLSAGVQTQIAEASCFDPSVQALVGALDTLFAGALDIEFPPAPAAGDHPLGGGQGVVRRQSPHGYLSEVGLSDLDQAQNAILLNDQSIEKPALVVTLNLDNTYDRNRLVTSFAGIAATARYGIFPLDTGAAEGDAAPGDTMTPPGPLANLPSNPEALAPIPPVAAGSANAAGAFPMSPGAIARALVDGLQFLLEHPALIPPLLAVWLLLMAPAYSLSRRRALLAATAARRPIHM